MKLLIAKIIAYGFSGIICIAAILGFLITAYMAFGIWWMISALIIATIIAWALIYLANHG